jgi:thiol-disulfide isomerase/thioredoxin
MKQVFYILAIVCFSTVSVIAEEGIVFFEGTFEEAKEKAKSESKLIFIDAYAVWCGPCKAMAANVFPKPEVGAVFNEHYINMKIDMERGIGLEFRKDYPVTAFPTLFFLDEDGNILERVVGAKQVPDLINLGLKHAAGRTPGKSFAKEYESGNRSPEVVYEYIKALNLAGKPTLSITNEFLKEHKDLDNPEVLKVIFEGATDSDSKVFDMLLSSRDVIEKLFSVEEVNDKIYKACLKTAYKAADFDYKELKEEAKAQIKEHLPSEYKKFSLQADLVFAAFTFNEKEFLSVGKQYVKVVGQDPEKAFEASLIAEMKFPKSEKVIIEATDWALQAAEKGKKSKFWMHHALLLEKLGRKKEALDSIYKARGLAEKDGDPLFRIEQIIQNLESQ